MWWKKIVFVAIRLIPVIISIFRKEKKQPIVVNDKNKPS